MSTSARQPKRSAVFNVLRVLTAGVVVSFLGALPLGTQNMAALQIAISDGLAPALLFGAGLVAADTVYIYTTLLAMQWIQRRKGFFNALQWVTLVIVVSLAAANFYAAFHPAAQKNVVLSNPLPKFLLGLLLNGLNPMQVPFWFGWTTVLFTKKIIQPRWLHYHLFAVGATLGMSAATLLFIFGGRLVAETIAQNQAAVYFSIGMVFALTAVWHTVKLLRRGDVKHQLEHPEEVTAPMRETLEKLDLDGED